MRRLLLLPLLLLPTVASAQITAVPSISASATNNITQLGGQNVTLGNGTVGAGTLRITIASDSTGTVAITQADNGLSVARLSSAASNNATSVTAANTTLYGIFCTNNSTSVAPSLKIYNKASAPAPATDNALIVMNFQVSAASASNVLGGFNITFPEGIALPTGFGYALVANMADTDNTSTSATIVYCNMSYRLTS